MTPISLAAIDLVADLAELTGATRDWQVGMSGVEVRSSPVEGFGLFATQPWAAGRRVRQINVLREITAETPLREELGERADHCDYPDGKTVLLGPPDCYLNHSCDPTAYVVYENDSCYIVARRDICVGDEITVDYSINVTGGDSWPCHCGAARCRRVVTGDYFLLPQLLQIEYRPLLAPWFVTMHGGRLNAQGRGPVNGV